jgi:cobalamin biosynthesis Mg chelatase CobN
MYDDDVCAVRVFRDSFQNVVELLDDMFQRAAAADEPDDMNFVRKHAMAMRTNNPAVDNPGARLFSNPAGDYGSMVNERVGASNWTDAAELGDTWVSRNAFSYGRGAERGAARGDVLQVRVFYFRFPSYSFLVVCLLLLRPSRFCLFLCCWNASLGERGPRRAAH